MSPDREKDVQDAFLKFWSKLDASMIRQGREPVGFEIAWSAYRAYLMHTTEDEEMIKRFLEHAAYGERND